MGAVTASAVEPLAPAVGDRPSIGDNRGNRQSGLAMPASAGNLRIPVALPCPIRDSKQRREHALLHMLGPGPTAPRGRLPSGPRRPAVPGRDIDDRPGIQWPDGGGEPGRHRAAPFPARAPTPLGYPVSRAAVRCAVTWPNIDPPAGRNDRPSPPRTLTDLEAGSS